MPLPTVLMTDVIRSTRQGNSHGGAYLVDLETGTHDKVIDWNAVDIDWSGRGAGRGLRGIAFSGDLVYIAASDELFVFDQNFEIVSSHKNPYLHHCHEIALDGDRLWLTSTSFDSVLEFDIPSARFVAGHTIHASQQLRIQSFDPNAPGGPVQRDTIHINSVWRENGKTFLSGVGFPMLGQLDTDTVRPIARVPAGTHNCRPYRDGVLYNNTASDGIVIADNDGTVRTTLKIMTYPARALKSANTPQDHARQGFGRGLCVTGDGLIIGGSSPSTVSVYDPAKGLMKTVNISMDVRNCPHGLEVCPW